MDYDVFFNKKILSRNPDMLLPPVSNHLAVSILITIKPNGFLHWALLQFLPSYYKESRAVSIT